MTPAEQLLRVIGEAHALLARERDLISRGDFTGLAALAGAKQAALEEIDEVIRRVRGTPGLRAALTGLIEDGRRNERLLAAARQGVAGARRRIDAIRATRRGAVAYDRHGAPIRSREDAVSESSRA